MRLSGRDILASAIILVLAAGLMVLYLRERGRVTVRSDQAALGTIVFKKLSATRRVSGGLVWERMRNNSPVYQQDTLRTGDASEAAIYFDDGTNLDMLEDSMLRLEFGKGTRTFAFLGGDISVHGPAGAGNADLTGLAAPAHGAATPGRYAISVGDRTLSLSESAQASLRKTGDTISVAVAAGQVGVTQADGTTQTLDRAKELSIDLGTGASVVVEHTVLPVAPQDNARLPLPREGRAELAFSWEAQGSSAATLELSASRDFETVDSSSSSGGSSVRVKVDPGTWYWRVRSADGAISTTRRFTLVSDVPPRLLEPLAGATVAFRKTLPRIRFSWTEMPSATAYIFEIATEPGFAKPVVRSRTVNPALTVDSLKEGTWYWRVSPVCALTAVEDAPPQEARAVVVSQRAAMTALTAAMPPTGSLFMVQEAQAKGVAFSWSPATEAVEYQLSVGPAPDMARAVITRTSDQPWLTLSGTEAAPLASPTSWYWAVRWKDAEGNLSPYSEPRLLRGIDGRLAVRLVFPPEGYAIADSLIQSTRFSWKCNVPAKAVFQLSPDPAFSSVTFAEPSDTETLIGGQWKTGTWYWRIRTLNVDGSVFHDTDPRMFRVVDPLPAPDVRAPAAGEAFALRQEDRYTITWDPVPGADYYQFRLFSEGAAGEALKSSATQQDTTADLPMGTYTPGAYRLLLQAFTLDKESSTRIIGYLGQTDFALRLITRMSLSAPPDRAVFEGLDARRHGVALAWAVPDRPESSELLVASDAALRSPVLKASAVDGHAVAPRLPAGDYWWTVRGTLAGLDLSSVTTRHFTVRPIPPLPMAGHLVPTQGYRFGPADFRASSSLRFQWDPVPGATRYELTVAKTGDQKPLIHEEALAESSWTLDDLSTLDNGAYRWTVTARGYDANGELEQDGLTAGSSFNIDLPALHAPAVKGKESFYGG